MPPERWYEFTQVETMKRPFWVRAETLEQARAAVRRGGPVTEGVPDIAPDGPDDLRIVGRGKVAEDQELVAYREGELYG